ncbi:DUF6338 family protein [Halococcus thailandensis]|uniref:Uncharacterized protein n=1 Tax=Halococcus thailandensis JCM 13552 TaxID=1227457 RepID=M0NFS5_9EURY|nr:DUF6338 family protein [Halococcus thailandensis]EMA56837.1 hypothetical protein C451_00495 [Halococcus thailandensis JCM 13552]
MPALSPENVLLSLIVVAPGFIAVYTAIIFGGLKESLSDGRLLGASIAAAFIIDPLFFWGYTLFGGEIADPTAAVGLFFEGGFRPERVLILTLLSVGVGISGAVAVSGDFTYIAREALQRQFDVNSHPHQPWEGSLKTANLVRVLTTESWFQGYIAEWSESGNERQITLDYPAEWDGENWSEMGLAKMIFFEEDIKQIHVVNEVNHGGSRAHPAGDGGDEEDDDGSDSQ